MSAVTRLAPRLGQAPGAALAAACLLALGCAESVRPVLGGLRIGAASTSLEMPVLQNEKAPFAYPRDAWEAGVGGETLLKIHISSQGAVDSVRVSESSGHASLDSAAVAGARELRYRPARHAGEPIGVWATLPVRYPLPGTASRSP